LALLIVSQQKDPKPWRDALAGLDGNIELRIWPEIGDPEDITFVLSWLHPSGIFRQFKNLLTISSMGAGVDHLLADESIAPTIKICRLVDINLAKSMAEYLLAAVTSIQQNFLSFHRHQIQQQWQPQPAVAQTTIGIMGLGQLGGFAAKYLQQVGFSISGWSRRPRQIDKIVCFAGMTAFGDFLKSSNILICLLPLTMKTRNILNKQTFAMLPQAAHLINVARGQHLNEQDLLDALDDGQINSATLDVFKQEPLPENHPFWRHENIFITPHISSISNPDSLAPQIIENYYRSQKGEPLLHIVNRAAGY